MTLEFMEGFDWLTNNTKILQKWNSGTIGGTSTTDSRYAGARYAYNLNGLTKSLNAADTTIIAGFAVRFNSPQSKDLIAFMEGGTKQIIIVASLSSFTAKRGVFTTLGTSSVGLTEDRWHYVEIKVYIHDTNGTVTIWLDGAEILSLSGVDTKEGGTGVVNSIQIDADVNDCWMDDLYVLMGSTATRLGDVRVCTVLPNGAGTTTEWDPSTGANYQNVDDTDPDGDTTYNSTSTAGEIDLYAFPDIAVTAGTVQGVQVTANCRKDDAGARQIKLIAKPASTNYLSDAIGITDTYFSYSKIWENNPETTAAWTVSEVNASEFGIEMDA